jgi:hypothetical protein
MKKKLFIIILCGLALHGYTIVPGYYGARSLSLGYASTAFNYDINSIFANPAILSSADYQLYGYQYQNSYLDPGNFGDNLSGALRYNLKNFVNLSANDKSTLFSTLKEMYQGKTGMYGFSSSVPGFISKGYGMSISLVDTAIVNPEISTGNNVFNKAIEQVTNEDIASLKMNFQGLKYKQISFAYAIQFSSAISVGISVHYLNGKITDFSESIVSETFTADANPRDYLEHGWKNSGNFGGKKFSKIMSDIGVQLAMGSYFSAGLVVKNFGRAKIGSPTRTLVIPRRIIAGIAFRPDPGWGFYLDMDATKENLLYNGEEMQPISFGIEKGFFSNKFFIRAGMRNDLAQKHFLGKESNVLYGMGIGFNLKSFVVDLAVGLNSGGSIKNLAVSGFIIVK